MASNRNKVALLAFAFLFIRFAVSAGKQQELVTEALRELHKLLDDDESGGIDSIESKDFLHDELKSEDNGERKREKYFHADGDDPSISLDDLTKAWMGNPVRNWTNEDMVVWLQDVVQLPQYEQTFVKNEVTGKVLPMLASKSGQFMVKVLGIVNVQHRTKLGIKATDVVLFGPVALRNDGSLFKNPVVQICVTMVAVIAWYAYKVKQKAQQQVGKLMAHVESLQQAELELKSLQERLDGGDEVEFQVPDKDRLNALQEEQQEEIQRLRFAEEELEEVRAALQVAHQELASRNFSVSSELHGLLRLTYLREKKYYKEKKDQVLQEFETARKECEKISKRKGNLLYALKLTHGNQFNDMDERIAAARSSLMIATHELEEQQLRWKQIETLCGQRIDSALVSPVGPDPVAGHKTLLASGEVAHTRWLLSSGGDSGSAFSLPPFGRGSVSEADMPMLHAVSAPGNVGNVFKMRNSSSDSSNGIAVNMPKKKVVGEKRGFLIGKSISEEDEYQLHESISSCSSCASLSTGLLAPATRSESPPVLKNPPSHHVVPLGKIGRQHSNPSMTLSQQGVSDDTDLPSVDTRNLYGNKSDYAKDYNSLACASIPHTREEPVITKARRANKTMDDLKRSTENVSDSEVVTKDGKKKRKRFWHKVMT